MLRHITTIAIIAMAAILCGCQTGFTDGSYSTEAELPRLDALVFNSNGSKIYGQVLVPSSQFGSRRPCAVLCHGFAGFTRWDDVAQDLCRAGIVVVIPHHRGAWGSEGEYTVSGCIRDAESLAAWAMGADFAAKYGADANAVYLIGHSMGGNSVINAAARINAVKGVALIAPCDIGFMARRMSKNKMLSFLNGEGLTVLRRASDEAVVDDIYANAEAMRFTNAAKLLVGKKVFLATGEYDTTVPSEPLEAFWAALPENAGVRVRKAYRCGHSMMGFRRDLAVALADFILRE